MKNRILIMGAAQALLISLAIFPIPVSGQGNTWAGASLAQMVEAAHWRFGAFRVNAALELANVGHDSDIYFGYLDESVPDYTFSAALPVQVLLPLGKKVVLDLFDSPQYLFYLETERERAWNNVFQGRVHFALERFYLQAGGGLSNVRYRLSPEFNVNVREKKDSLGGTFLWQASREVSIAFLYEAAKFDYSENEIGGIDLAETLNRKEDYLDLVAYLQPGSKFRLFIDGQYGAYNFAGPASGFKNTRSYGVFGGVDFIPLEEEAGPVAPLQGSISLGYQYFDVLDPLLVDGSAFVGAVDVTAGLFKRTAGHAFFSRDYNFSVYSSAAYYLSTSYGAGISRLLSRRTAFSYDLSFSRSAYPEAGGGVPVGQNYRYTTHSINLSAQLARNLQISLLAILSRRVIGDPSASNSRNFFGFNLTYGFTAGSISAPSRGLAQ